MFMFQRRKQKKKQLWCACETVFVQYKKDINVMPSVQPQTGFQGIVNEVQGNSYSMSSIRNASSNESSSQQHLLQYPSVVADGSYPMELESGSEEMSIELGYEARTDGCNYESLGDSSIDYNDVVDYHHQYSNSLTEVKGLRTEVLPPSWQQQLKTPSFQQASTIDNRHQHSAVMTARNVLRDYCCTGENSVSNDSSIVKCHHLPNQNHKATPPPQPPPTTTTTHSTVTSAITAAVFGNCCRSGVSLSNESSIASYPYPQNNRNYTLNNNNNAIGINNNNNNTSSSKNNYNCYEQKSTTVNDDPSNAFREKLFKVLMKKLKDPQVETLCQVVGATDIDEGKRQHHHGAHPRAQLRSQPQTSHCVLVPRETIEGEEPHVIACYLWLWPDLKNSAELKRIPLCPTGKEKVYVCCNPAHWNRILIPETVPPPYQQSEMDRLRPEDRAPSENSKDGGVSTFSGTTTGHRAQIPESFTTNGEDHSLSSLLWCEIAYWELATRVGARYKVRNSSVNIYSEGSGGMSLKELAEKKGPATHTAVEKARQKIGLGITLSQEADSVWLYNRSEAPIFVYSPTLPEDCRPVSKVPPGYCLNAFDKNRPRIKKPEKDGVQTGPIDTNSIKISFAKGWGSKYRRSEITACPCWLEVLFPPR